MTTSQNGWTVIPSSGDPLLHKWVVPDTNRFFVARRGSGGFLLIHYALWFHEEIERLDLGLWDEWGWAYRPVRGSTVFSNHASGTALDLNATRHPLGVPPLHTFTPVQLTKMRHVLDKVYRGSLRSGAFYNGRPDGMHIEVNVPLARAEHEARRLTRSKRGKRILAANPGQKKVIFS